MRASFLDSDSFFENEMESKLEQRRSTNRFTALVTVSLHRLDARRRRRYGRISGGDP
jgi:hypothetical protein